MSAYCCIKLDFLLTLNHDARNHEFKTRNVSLLFLPSVYWWKLEKVWKNFQYSFMELYKICNTLHCQSHYVKGIRLSPCRSSSANPWTPIGVKKKTLPTEFTERNSRHLLSSVRLHVVLSILKAVKHFEENQAFGNKQLADTRAF